MKLKYKSATYHFRFLMAHTHWMLWKIQESRQIKKNRKYKNEVQLRKEQTTQNTAEQSYPSLNAFYITTLDQKMRWAYSTTVPSPYGAITSAQRYTVTYINAKNIVYHTS